MKRFFIFLYGLMFLALLIKACKEPYAIPSQSSNNHTLIVEGFLNVNGQTSIKLSRSVELSSQYNSEVESGATVVVEGEDSQKYPLTHQANGIYVRPKTNYPENQRYRLHIETKDGEVYYSEYVSVKITPQIEKVFWERTDEGVGIYVNTSDPNNSTRYYRWEWEETWKFTTKLKADIYLKYIRDTVLVWPIDSLPNYPYARECWKDEKSSEILIETTERLSSDLVSKKAVTLIPNRAWKLSEQYSILVKQYAMSKESYQYWDKIVKNSSDLGSVYSPMPSEVEGNLQCSSNRDLKVIGFFEATTQTEKRIFINSDRELRNWGYDEGCPIKSIPNERDSIKTHVMKGNMTLYRYADDRMRRLYYVFPKCIDCSVQGTTVRPPFWPR